MTTHTMLYECAEQIAKQITGDIVRNFSAPWAEKHSHNVPGPFYTGQTDNCLTGRLEAPNNVLYDETGYEFIFRQPTTAEEFRMVLRAAAVDPFVGYAYDGNDHWSLTLIREWWADRTNLQVWIDRQLARPDVIQHSEYVEQRQLEGLLDFKHYLANGLHDYLRAYAFFLEHWRNPTAQDALPVIEW